MLEKNKEMRIRIKQARLDAGKTQTDLAKVLGISQTNYQRRESGLSRFTIEEVEKIGVYFGLKTGHFLTTQPTDTDKDGGMDYWKKEYYKLLGKYELVLDALGENHPFLKGVGKVAKRGRS